MDASSSVMTSPFPTFINLTVLNPRIPTAIEHCKFPRRFHIRSLSLVCVCVFVGAGRGSSGPHPDDYCAWEHTSLWWSVEQPSEDALDPLLYNAMGTLLAKRGDYAGLSGQVQSNHMSSKSMEDTGPPRGLQLLLQERAIWNVRM